MKISMNPEMIPQTGRVLKKIKKAALPVTVGILAGAASLTSCSDKKEVSNKPKTEVVANEKNTPLDLTKPNIPYVEIGKGLSSGYVTYKNLDGSVQTVKFRDNGAGPSLYKAIAECSTPENPEITDILAFETSALANGLMHSNRSVMGYSKYDPVRLFQELVNRATAPKSEKGDTITVKEYTEMMRGWSGI